MNTRHVFIDDTKVENCIIGEKCGTITISVYKDLPDFSKYNRIEIVGCGSAYHAGLIAKNLIEKAMENRDFGNARFVENLKEAILREKAKIVEKCYNFESLEELEKMLYSITADDIPQYLVENTKSKEKVLGFQPKK